jgi:hypothetical protein
MLHLVRSCDSLKHRDLDVGGREGRRKGRESGKEGEGSREE